MIPPPPPGKPVAFYDTECFPNYWLLKFKVSSEIIYTFSLQAGEQFDATTRTRICSLFQLFTVVSFHGIYYDVPMICAALAGYDCEQLKWLSDQIILLNAKPWELDLPKWQPTDHIDIIETLPGSGSQKEYAGRIHCRTMRDLPYADDKHLSREEMLMVDSYCENDLSVLEDLFTAAAPLLAIRERLGKRYGIDLRSKSDAQVGEAVIKHRCEQAMGMKLYKQEIDWNLKFRYQPPAFLAFRTPQLQQIFQTVCDSIFSLSASGHVGLPESLESLEIPFGKSVYKLGIGGLHSQEKSCVYKTGTDAILRELDVASYYPSLIINSGKVPPSLGPVFTQVFSEMKAERLTAKALEKKLKKMGDTTSPEAVQAHAENEGGKVGLNGPFGKLGNSYSILYAPEMLIQTTVSGQLSILMLIEWLELYGIPVVSANTDGIVTMLPRHLEETCAALVNHWQEVTGLEMDREDYQAMYKRDVNAYFAIKSADDIKRKGEYNEAGLISKKSPSVEICSDAVADLLSKGTPLLYTLSACRDIRKFVTVRKVTGGAVKLWGEGPKKEMAVENMTPILKTAGWVKIGRRWERNGVVALSRDAYNSCFAPQRPEFIGKVIRWYYSTSAPGSIVYNTNGNQVSLSYGAKPCMILPDEFPNDIDYNWYMNNCESILKDIGYVQATV